MNSTASLRAAVLLALCAVPACDTASQGVTVGGSGTSAVVESDPVAGDGTIVARWEQTFLAAGTADAYLYASGDPQGACHLSSGTAAIDFHCEGHAGTITITDVDPFRPHVVTVTLLRGSDETGLTVAQDGAPAAQDRSRVPGTPNVSPGGRLRLQVEVERGASIRIDGFEAREVN